jgi:predicted PurR-regulated permease PerM
MANKKIHDGFSEETRIALLEQSIGFVNESLKDIKNELKSINTKLDSQSESLNSKIDAQGSMLNSKVDSHFRWTLGFMFGLYGIVITTLITAVGKANHWF